MDLMIVSLPTIPYVACRAKTLTERFVQSPTFGAWLGRLGGAIRSIPEAIKPSVQFHVAPTADRDNVLGRVVQRVVVNVVPLNRAPAAFDARIKLGEQTLRSFVAAFSARVVPLPGVMIGSLWGLWLIRPCQIPSASSFVHLSPPLSIIPYCQGCNSRKGARPADYLRRFFSSGRFYGEDQG